MVASENTALQTVNVFVHGSYCLAALSLNQWDSLTSKLDGYPAG